MTAHRKGIAFRSVRRQSRNCRFLFPRLCNLCNLWTILSVQERSMERKTAADYPQELLDLFHEYQHGDIDRRAFLEGAAKFAIGGLTVAAIFGEMTPNFAWAQQVPPDDKRIKVGYEVVPSPAGNGTIKGYLARPAKSGKRPVVLVIHETADSILISRMWRAASRSPTSSPLRPMD